MSLRSYRSRSGFTLVELLIGMTLSLMIMGAVLSSYIFLGRNFTRSLGISSWNQPTLESQARRTMAYFAQDVRMATGIDTTGVAPKVSPSETGLTLILPTANAGTSKYITYYYNNTSAAVTLSTYSIPAYSLVRIDLSTTTAITLHSNLVIYNSSTPTTEFYFRYFDSSGNPYDNSTSPYTMIGNYLAGIKQVSLSFASQSGLFSNNTLTQVYRSASPRLVIRNRAFLQ